MTGIFGKKYNESIADLNKDFETDAHRLQAFLLKDIQIIENELKELREATAAIPSINADPKHPEKSIHLENIAKRLAIIHGNVKKTYQEQEVVEKSSPEISTIIAQMEEIISKISKNQ